MLSSILKFGMLAPGALNPNPAAIKAHAQSTIERGGLATEVVVETDALKSKVNDATTISYEDAANPPVLAGQAAKFNDNSPEGGEKPKSVQEMVGEDFELELRTLRSYQTPEREASYHKLFNDPTLRAKYQNYRAKYQAEIDAQQIKVDRKWQQSTTTGHGNTDLLSRVAQLAGQDLYKLKKKLDYLDFLFAPENELFDFCTIDNQTEGFKKKAKAKGMELKTKEYSKTDIAYLLFVDGEKATYFTNAKRNKSTILAFNKKGEMIIDDLKKKDNLHWYTKFREINGVIERWSRPGKFEWRKIDTYPKKSNETAFAE